MFKTIRSRALLYKLFLSYIIVFAIPLAIMTSILYRISVTDVKKEIENSNMHKLVQLKDTLDMRMQELEYVSLNINFDMYLTPLRMSINEYTKMEGIDKIGVYKANNAFIDELYIYYRNSDSVFSRSGVVSNKVFSENTDVAETGEDGKRLYDYIATVANPEIRTLKSAGAGNDPNFDKLMYFYPIYYVNGRPDAVLVFAIKRATFHKMMQDLLGDSPGNVFIFDRDDNLIASTSGGSSFTGVALDALKNSNAPGIYDIKNNGENLSLIKAASDYNGWNYVVTMETSTFFEKAVYMKTLILEIALSLLAFGIFIIILFARGNYKPINVLLGYIKLHWPQAGKPDRMNEIEHITDAMTTAMEQNKDLQDQIDFQLPLLEEQVLTKLLKGELGSEKHMLRLAGSLRIKLNGPYFTVLVVGKPQNGETAVSGKYKSDVLSALKENYSNDGNLYPVELLHIDGIAIIANLKGSERIKGSMEQFVCRIKQVIERQIGGKVVIGVGRVYEDATQINRSFVEALAAIDNDPVRGDTGISYFDDITELKKQLPWYPAESQLRFVQALKQGDLSVALEALQDIAGDMPEKEGASSSVNYLCLDMINMVAKTVRDMNSDKFDKDIDEIRQFSSPDDFLRRLEILVLKICNDVEEGKKRKSINLYDQISGYIQSKVGDSNLGLEDISEKFNISVYYLSRIFKEKMGLHYSDYITKLRMQKAKELLENTDIKLKDMVASLGYTDLPCFMRKFKKIEGMTPGEYRKLHKQKAEENTPLSPL